MKKTILTTLAALLLWCCGTKQAEAPADVAVGTDPEKVEVIYFHGKQRCATCRAIEQLAREVTDEYADAKKEGRLAMQVVDISQRENEPLAASYEVSWSSLFVARGDRRENLTETAFANARSNPDKFKAELRHSIDQMLQ